jgi:hypothetical protein
MCWNVTELLFLVFSLSEKKFSFFAHVPRPFDFPGDEGRRGSSAFPLDNPLTAEGATATATRLKAPQAPRLPA